MLFEQVRLVLLSRDSLLTVVTHELVREDRDCLTKVLDAIDVVRTASEDTKNESPRKRLETHAVVVGGGHHFFCYLPEKGAWKSLSYLTEQQNNISLNTTMINFHDQLYTFRGCQFQRYDPVFNIWTTLDMDGSCSITYVGVCRGQIYAIHIDYSETTGKTSTVKNFNVESCSWQTVHSSNLGCRYDSCIVAAGNCLYVLGGEATKNYSNPEYVTVSERFDTIGHQWEQIANMQHERGYAFGVAFQGQIFVAGGKDRSGQVLRSCEVYNISTNEWQVIESLNVGRVSGSMVSVNGTIYVLGGSRYLGRDEYTVEVYDPVGNKWKQKTTIPVERIPKKQRSAFRGCALKLSRGVLGKIK